MVLSDEDVTALIADFERVQRERETALRADLEREYQQKAKWEKELQKRAYEAELERLQYETELEWPQLETVEMPMFPLLGGPQQSAPTAVALAAEAPAAEVMTDNSVFPDTAVPDASVERAAIKLTSAAGSSSKICGERRTFRYYNSSCPKHGSNSNSSNSSKSSGNGSNSSSNDTTSNHDSLWEATYVGALLRPFDPGKGCQRDVRRGKAVLGQVWISLLIAENHGGECSVEGDGLRAEGEFLAFIWLVSITTGDLRVRYIALVVSGCWTSFLLIISPFKSANLEVWFQFECAPEQPVSMVTVNWHFLCCQFFLWYPNLVICYSNM